MKYCESIRIESNLLNQDDTSSDRYTVKILQMNSNDGNEVEINILMNR